MFKLTPAGKLTTLHSFNATEGTGPGALVLGSNGSFYGTKGFGGSSTNCTNGCGTVFEITPTGTLTILHDFVNTDGSHPNGLIQASDGNFYGTTYNGGASGNCISNCGTVFKITPKGVLTTLHSFELTDGEYPYGTLLQATNGKFYGTTYGSGDNSCPNVGCGTLFSLSTGLGPFVETLPTSGQIGSKVKILGTNLKGATAVKFNTIAATFTVVSATEIVATVPKGATTGKVHVTTPGGTLSSNVVFRVP